MRPNNVYAIIFDPGSNALSLSLSLFYSAGVSAAINNSVTS